MAKVFISYSRKDIAFAKRLTGELQNGELDFWIDWEGIPPTVDWWKEIEKGIEEADVFLFFISPDSAKSRVCGQEIETAVKNGKRIIPIVVRDIAWEDTPKHLGHLNYIFIREMDDFNTAVKKLITAIQTDYEWAATHRRLQVKALDWERNNKDTGFLLRGRDLQDAELDLATNTSKDPHPTDLQREYVFVSRKATDRQRGITTIISIAAVIVLAGLAVFGFYQAGEATKQAQIALARQLAAQAQSTDLVSSSNLPLAVLLSIQSLKLSPTGDAAGFLLNNNLAAQPMGSIEQAGDVLRAVFSSDGKYIVSQACEKYAEDLETCLKSVIYVWEASTRKEISYIVYDGNLLPIRLSADGKSILTGAENRILIWETETGTEIFRLAAGEFVSSTAFSPDGKYVISGGCEVSAEDDTTCIKGAAILWDSASGKEVTRFPHKTLVTAVAISPDGKFLATGTDNSVGHIWELAAAKEITIFYPNDSIPEEHGYDGQFSVTFSRDGKYVATGSWLTDAKVWDTATGNEIGSLPDATPLYTVKEIPTGSYPLAFSPVRTSETISKPYESIVLSGNPHRNAASVWVPERSANAITHLMHNDLVLSAVFNADGTQVVTGSRDGLMSVWIANNWGFQPAREIARMVHADAVSSVAFSPDGKYVISTSGHSIFFWKATSGREISYITHDSYVASVAFSPDGKYIFSSEFCNYFLLRGGICPRGSTIRISEVATGKQISRIAYSTSEWRSGDLVRFSSDGKYAAVTNNCELDDASSNCLKSSFSIWNIAAGKEAVRIGHDNLANSLRFSADSRYVVVGFGRNVGIWETTTGKKVAHFTTDSSVQLAVFSQDGKYIASAGRCDEKDANDNCTKGGSVHVWDVTARRELSQRVHNDNVLTVAFSPNSKYIVSGGDDKNIRIWEIISGKEIVYMSDTSSVFSVAFSPDNQYVATGNQDKTIRLWNALTGMEIAHMAHAYGEVSFIQFSLDGNYLLSIGGDNSVRVWKIPTGEEIARMLHDNFIFSATFSPDGKYVVTGGADNIAHIWAWQTQDVIANACTTMIRNLTRAEWAQFIGDAMPYQAVCENLPVEPEVSLTQTPAP